MGLRVIRQPAFNRVQRKKGNTPDQIHVSGTVKDKLGNPMVGVTIKVQGKPEGTVTDGEGVFSLEVAPTDSLEISYIGYQRQVIAVRNHSNLQITLEANTGSLNEVVVVAYGEQKKISITGATYRRFSNRQI